MEADIVTRLAEGDRVWQKFSEFCTRAMIFRQRMKKELESRNGRPGTTRKQRRQRRLKHLENWSRVRCVEANLKYYRMIVPGWNLEYLRREGVRGF